MFLIWMEIIYSEIYLIVTQLRLSMRMENDVDRMHAVKFV